jgi:hypothetical protein
VSSVRDQGHYRTPAEYNFGTLEADLPGSCRVPAVLSAAETTLRRRGYSVERRGWTEEVGGMDAEPGAGSDGGGVEVDARTVPYGTRVAIRVGMLGDETRSRDVLNEVLARLGQ